MIRILTCGYHGCQVIPSGAGCICADCRVVGMGCENCTESQMHDAKYLEARNCEECMQRAVDAARLRKSM